MSNEILVKPFQDLYNAAKQSSEESIASPSLANRVSKKAQEALLEALGDATKAAKVAAQKAKLNFTYFAQKENDEDLLIEAKTPIRTVVHWLVVGFKDVMEKVNDQGEVIAAIVQKLGDVLDG